ncbi:MAG TPA: hypothetical protein VF519_16625 [Mycobacteriales bacterium]|jgi:uncharacterized membrane protein YccC
MSPEWFYSSLAQVTASLVGFLGAFLLVRLSSYIADWRDAASALDRLQRSWSIAHTSGLHERAYEALWELRVLDDRRQAERFPREIPAVFALVGLVFGVGVVLPLLALGAPSNAAQAAYLGPVALLVVAGAAIMLLAARRAFREWRTVALWDVVHRRLDEERDNEAAYEEWLRTQT